MEEPKYPNYIEDLITDEFLMTFIKELDETFKSYQKPKCITYWNFYQWFDNSAGFNEAFLTSCILHNLNELYEYRESFYNKDMDTYDELGCRITEMLYEKGIIEEGDSDHAMPVPWMI